MVINNSENDDFLEEEYDDMDYDENDYSENQILLEDVEILEKNQEGTTLRLIIKDGTWKDLTIPKEVIEKL